MGRRTKSWRVGQWLVLDHMATKHKVGIFISMSLQSEEVESLYDGCSKVLEQFGLLSCSFFFSPSLHGEFPTLYSPFLIIFTLHLLIIWTFIRVLVPSATFPSSLWVALAKVALFRRLLHINMASKVAIVHLMWWCQSSLRYFQVFFLLPCPWSAFLSLNLLRRSL